MRTPGLERVPLAAFKAVRALMRGAGMGAARAALKDMGALQEPAPVQEHLDQTLGWLYRAHDAADRGGVARSYSLRRHPRYQVTGWIPAYPETTGYIIPTLYEVARELDRPEAAERALQMAHWEADMQMEDGAVRGGTVADEPSPAVFNTGQVLFGWLEAHEESGDDRFAKAAERAAAWLVQAQDEDGVWRRGASRFVSAEGHMYNVRVAWALALYAKKSGDAGAKESAHRAARQVLAKQNAKGWVAENCLTDNAHPLLHTIAYTAQGILETGLVLEAPEYVQAARAIADALAPLQSSQDFLAGRYDQAWQPAASWTCLTGNAQMAIVWRRLHQRDGREQDRALSQMALRSVLRTQRLADANPGIRGGVAGSYPIWGAYGTYEYLNWAAKFLVDALLGEVREQPAGTRG